MGSEVDSFRVVEHLDGVARMVWERFVIIVCNCKLCNSSCALLFWLLLLPAAGVPSLVKVPAPLAFPAVQVAVLESHTSFL